MLNNSCCALRTALQVTKHPRSSTCVNGESVVLSVVAVGAEPLHYKWKKNGEDITDPECTGTNLSTLTIHSFSDVHEGNYSCTIGNNEQCIHSEPANLALGIIMLSYNTIACFIFMHVLLSSLQSPRNQNYQHSNNIQQLQQHQHLLANKCSMVCTH